MDYIQIITVVLLVILLLIVYLLHKIRRVHLMLFQMRSQNDRSIDNIFRQAESLLALYKDLGFSQSLPSTRGWAGSPDFLFLLKDLFLKQKPKVVVECSSGVSTLVLAQCMKLQGEGRVYSLEHDREYAQKTVELLERHGLQDWATIICAPLTKSDVSGQGREWYDVSKLPEDIGNIDMLVIDGPPAVVDGQARYPALPLLKSRLSDKAVIVLDDADRPGEKEIVKMWQAEHENLVLSQPQCEKGCAMLVFKNK